jgi:hypothetical protein
MVVAAKVNESPHARALMEEERREMDAEHALLRKKLESAERLLIQVSTLTNPKTLNSSNQNPKILNPKP